MSKFILDFQELRESEETFSFKLDDEYFAAIGATEVRGGEVETTVKVSRAAGCFEVVFSSEGEVTVDCSRCLDPMSLPVNTCDKLYVKYGEKYLDEGDELIIVPEDAPKLDLSWHIYEFIALSIPAQHSHPEGECNPQMMELLSGNLEPEQSDDTNSGEAIDPRWAKLMQLKN
ncbi:MAG: DUF177 domain-containing protein [Bacteroidaceae bacterium]|nr:DUF177 domain-containing protein [Bacteroidaceae bacterium]